MLASLVIGYNVNKVDRNTLLKDLERVMSIIILSGLAVFFTILYSHIKHTLNKTKHLKISYSNWNTNRHKNRCYVKGEVQLYNTSKKNIFVMNLDLVPALITDPKKIIDVKITATINTEKQDSLRNWVAIMIEPNQKLTLTVQLSAATNNNTSHNSFHISGKCQIYGWFGYHYQALSWMVTEGKLKPPSAIANLDKSPKYTIPIKTHILGVTADPVDTIDYYTKSIRQQDDAIILSESALAIMQGKYILFENIDVSRLAKILCQLFGNSSSFSSAAGIQALINNTHPVRVVFAAVVGAALKLLYIRGGFYIIAGKKSSAIDDVTGTLPPYDKSIVLGPINANSFSKEVEKRLNCQCAVVDCNDLGNVNIIGKSGNIDKKYIINMLTLNPAGNSDEKTPIVIIKSKY